MGVAAKGEERQKIINALGGGAMTINQITEAVGFEARNFVNNMVNEGVLQKTKEKVSDAGAGRKVIAFCVRSSCRSLDCAMMNLGRC